MTQIIGKKWTNKLKNTSIADAAGHKDSLKGSMRMEMIRIIQYAKVSDKPSLSNRFMSLKACRMPGHCTAAYNIQKQGFKWLVVNLRLS